MVLGARLIIGILMVRSLAFVIYFFQGKYSITGLPGYIIRYDISYNKRKEKWHIWYIPEQIKCWWNYMVYSVSKHSVAEYI